MNYRFFVLFDVLALIAINLILWTSLYIQFAYHELPCPLCLLQRMGIFAISIGYVLNLCFGAKAKHYAISSIAGILTASIAMIQILLHIVPYTGNYGSPFLGLHLYTWVSLLSIIFALGNSILVLFLNEFVTTDKNSKKLGLYFIIPIVLCLIINMISSFAECGFTECPADPVSYWISQFFK